MTARAERRRWAKLLPAAGSKKKKDERKAGKDSRGRRLQPRIDAIDAHAVDGGGSLGAWELGPQRPLLWEGKSRCDATAGSRSQPRIHGSFSVSACCGWLNDSRDGVMQRDEALLFPLGVAQTGGFPNPATQSTPHVPCPAPTKPLPLPLPLPRWVFLPASWTIQHVT